MSKQSNFGDTVYIKKVIHKEDYCDVIPHNGQYHIRYYSFPGIKYDCKKVTIMAIGSDGSWLLSNGCKTYMLDGVRTVSIFSNNSCLDGTKVYHHYPVLTQEECLDYLEHVEDWNHWNYTDFIFEDDVISHDEWAGDLELFLNK